MTNLYRILTRKKIAVHTVLAMFSLFTKLAWAISDTEQLQDSQAIEGITYGGPVVIPEEFNGDLRDLPPPSKEPVPIIDRPVRQPLSPPKWTPLLEDSTESLLEGATPVNPYFKAAPMPATTQNFAGMSFNDSCSGGQCGSGWPPDTNGDVGPNHYIQAVNGSYAIYNKTGTRLAAFTENQLWNTVGTTPCNGYSNGDPVVLYDGLADRWILTHFAWDNNVLSNGFYQCFAVSKTSDPVSGGWWFYPLRVDTGIAGQPPLSALNDYGKFGIWNDCLYMSANEFDMLSPSGAFLGTLFASLNRANLYAGAPLTWSLGFLSSTPANPASMIPSNLSGQAGLSIPPGTPNYFVSESITDWAFEVRKFVPGSGCGSGGAMSAPVKVSQTSYTVPNGNIIPQPNTTNKLDVVDDRLMQKVQYRKVGTTESLWVVHNVQTSGRIVGEQWSQINVTNGNIATTPIQQQIHAPDITLHRWMGSLAVDKNGDMALGYSRSGSTSPNFPSIAYAGRLASDILNTLPQTETTLISGAGSQVHYCGSSPCSRWGDYSAMSVDPVDDCTFWYTSQYYSSQSNGNIGNWQTRIGSFKFPSCTGSTSLPEISINDITLLEGNSGTTSFTFTVTLSAASASPVTVLYSTADGTATAGSDYTAVTNATLTIPAGQTSQTFTVNVIGDTVVEPNETFTVNLSSPNGATIADGQGIGTITNDDVPPTPSLDISDVTLPEGNSGTTSFTFTVNLSTASASPVTVLYSTADGTATAGSDYTAVTNTTLTIPAGQTSQTFTVNVIGDTVIEPNETFTVNLSSPNGATIADGQGIGTISNDDGGGSPDFVISGITINPTTPTTGRPTFSATVTVWNQGAAPGYAGYLEIWANQPNTQACLATGDAYFLIGTLGAGERRTFTLNLPTGSAGSKTLRAFVDSACDTNESNDINNQSTFGYTVTAATQMPDFVVTSVTLTPSTPRAQSTYDAAVTVRNQGPVAGDGGYLDVWTNQATPVFCYTDGDAYLAVGSLQPGESRTLTIRGLPSGTNGTKTLRAFVDSYCQTSESSESNNQWSQSYTVLR